MHRQYPSLEAVREAFDTYARIEPRLEELWERCREAAPPAYEPDEPDEYDIDDTDSDELAARHAEGWCSEQFFFDHVKSDLMLLVGVYRRTGPSELQTTKAYDAVYELLLAALSRSCTCCADDTGDDADENRIAS